MVSRLSGTKTLAKVCFKTYSARCIHNRHLRKLIPDPSPNLSPKQREALIPPYLQGKGGRGVRSAREFKVSKSFPEMSNTH